MKKTLVEDIFPLTAEFRSAQANNPAGRAIGPVSSATAFHYFGFRLANNCLMRQVVPRLRNLTSIKKLSEITIGSAEGIGWDPEIPGLVSEVMIALPI